MNWDLVTRALTALRTLLTALSVFVAYTAFRGDHDRSRRQYSFQLIAEMHKQLRESRKQLSTTFPEFYSDQDIRKLSQRDSDDLFRACPTDTQKRFTCEDRGIAGDYLNLLEYVATAYMNHVVDRKMIEDSLAPMIVFDYEYFENFVKVVERERKRRVWPPLQAFVVHIKSRIPTPIVRQPTG